MQFKEFLQENIVILDGGMGTMLQARGLGAGELPERWNVSHPEVITEIHKLYYEAGSNVVSTNTFGANVFKFSEAELDGIIGAAVANARAAEKAHQGENAKNGIKKETFVALDIGPSGKLLEPMGTLSFDDAVEAYGKIVRIGAKYQVDLIYIETMNDCYETKAALLAAKENCNLPVMVSNAYGEGGRLMTGATPAAMVAMVESLGADAIGCNCSLGPKQLKSVVGELLVNASIPVILKPNAGLPKVVDGKTTFDVLPDEFAEEVAALLQAGVGLVGGCCGTNPDYIVAVAEEVKKLDENAKKCSKSICDKTVVSSYSGTVIIGEGEVVIGNRIQLGSDEEITGWIKEGAVDDLMDVAFDQMDEDAQIIGVNLSDPEVMVEAVTSFQEMIRAPFMLSSTNCKALEAGLRHYNGKPMMMVGEESPEYLDEFFALAGKYGAVVLVCENSVGNDVIAAIAQKYGVLDKNLIFVQEDGKTSYITIPAED